MLIAALMVGVGLGSFAIGPLRGWLALEQIYRLSAFYPIAVIGLAWWWVVVGWRRAAVEAEARV
jgi:hypothetical protein